MRKFLRDRSKIISISNILIDRMFEKEKKRKAKIIITSVQS